MNDKLTKEQQEQREKAALKHGGAAGIRALSKGLPFTGLALAEQERVKAELADKGARHLLELNAIRLQTVSNLYFEAILGAEDMGRVESLVKSWGWLVGSATRAVLALMAEDKNAVKDRTSAVDVLNAIREAQNNEQHN
jgi:hypothetical protein